MLLISSALINNSFFRKTFYWSLPRFASTHHNRDYLKERLVELIPGERIKIKEFNQLHEDKVVDSVTVGKILGGMRDIKALYHEPSLLDPIQGIKFRGYTVDEVCKKLLSPPLSQPLPEAMFWLLVTGELPTSEQTKWLSEELARRAELPAYLINIINSFPDNLHPMAQLSAAIILLSRFSKFSVAYTAGDVPKSELWKPMYEDCMNLIAKLPVIASLIYRNSFHDGMMETLDINADWASNYARLLGINSTPDFVDYLRLYLSLHADHEGGNASSHTAHLVGSTLSDVFLSFGAAIGALAGPLHGRANQEVMEYINELISTIGVNVNEDKLRAYVKSSLTKGVIPGYGHAVLRNSDPRFIALLRFAQERLHGDARVKLVQSLFDVVPDILKSTEKVKNPWPNVDAISGTILNQFNMIETDYYTVPFAVSRCLGVSAALIWSRALLLPIERPKSLDMQELSSLVA